MYKIKFSNKFKKEQLKPKQFCILTDSILNNMHHKSTGKELIFQPSIDNKIRGITRTHIVFRNPSGDRISSNYALNDEPVFVKISEDLEKIIRLGNITIEKNIIQYQRQNGDINNLIPVFNKTLEIYYTDPSLMYAIPFDKSKFFVQKNNDDQIKEVNQNKSIVKIKIPKIHFGVIEENYYEIIYKNNFRKIHFAINYPKRMDAIQNKKSVSYLAEIYFDPFLKKQNDKSNLYKRNHEAANGWYNTFTQNCDNINNKYLDLYNEGQSNKKIISSLLKESFSSPKINNKKSIRITLTKELIYQAREFIGFYRSKINEDKKV